MKTEKAKSAADLDLRVRARHLASGHLDPKYVERYLAELVDVEANADSVPFDQPAIAGRDQGAT